MIELQGVKGLKELDARLRDFPLDLQKKVLFGALRKAIKPVIDAAKANAPEAADPHWFYPYIRKGRRGKRIMRILSEIRAGRKALRKQGLQQRVRIQPGNIRRNIRAIRMPGMPGKEVRFFVGPVRRGRGYENDPWYWRFLEYGTAHSPARPFLRPALASHASKVVYELGKSLQRGIDTMAKRYGGA